MQICETGSARGLLSGLHVDVYGSTRGRRPSEDDRSVVSSLRRSRRFRSEATGAAQIVASRFGAGPGVVRFNSKTSGEATVEALEATLQASAKKMNGESDILFLILTSHGSRHGLAVKAGRLVETLMPSNLAKMLDRTGVRPR